MGRIIGFKSDCRVWGRAPLVCGDSPAAESLEAKVINESTRPYTLSSGSNLRAFNGFKVAGVATETLMSRAQYFVPTVSSPPELTDSIWQISSTVYI